MDTQNNSTHKMEATRKRPGSLYKVIKGSTGKGMGLIIQEGWSNKQQWKRMLSILWVPPIHFEKGRVVVYRCWLSYRKEDYTKREEDQTKREKRNEWKKWYYVTRSWRKTRLFFVPSIHLLLFVIFLLPSWPARTVLSKCFLLIGVFVWLISIDWLIYYTYSMPSSNHIFDVLMAWSNHHYYQYICDTHNLLYITLQRLYHLWHAHVYVMFAHNVTCLSHVYHM